MNELNTHSKRVSLLVIYIKVKIYAILHTKYMLS